jgi:hypothetical protein
MTALADTANTAERGGINYHLELRWEGVPSLADLSAAEWFSALESAHVG